MALSDLRTPTMGSLTHHLTTTARPVLEGSPMLAALLPRLDALQAEFVTLAQTSQAHATAVAELRSQATSLDAQHDGGLDRCYSLLGALAPFFDAPQAAALIELRDRLMPGGLSMKQRSYQDEGAAAASAKAAFSDADKDLLRAVSPQGVDLVAAMDAWIAAGLELRDVDAARATRSDAPKDGPAVVEMRRRWMKAVGALRAVSEMVELDADGRATVFAKIEEEDARAVARRGLPEV